MLFFAMIPKVDGDATPLGQRPLCVLPVVYRFWASARMMQLEPWFKSWVPHSVFSAGNGRSSVEAWFSTALDIEECLAGGVEGDVHLFVADVVKSFDTVDRGVLDRFWVVLVYLLGSVVRTLSIMPRLGYDLNLLLALESLELGMVAFLRGVH